MKPWTAFAVASVIGHDWDQTPLAVYVEEGGAEVTFVAPDARRRPPVGNDAPDVPDAGGVAPSAAFVVEALLDHLTRPGAAPVVYLYTGSPWDARLLVAACDQRRWPWQVLGGAPHVVSITVQSPTTGVEVRIVDGPRMLPEDPGGSFERSYDPLNLEEDWALRASCVVDAVLHDARAWVRALVRFRTALAAHGVQGGGSTVSALASAWVRASAPLAWWKLYARKGYKHFERHAEFAMAEDLAREAYVGARTQAWHDGLMPRPVHTYDLQSAYSWAMLQKLPTYPGAHLGPARTAVETAARLRDVGFSRASVACPEGLALPVLPRRGAGGLVFDREPFEGVFTHVELAHAVRHGYDVRLHETRRWKHAAWLAPFVRAFYPARRAAQVAGDGPTAFALKVLLNTLPGRLAERAERARVVAGRGYRLRAYEEALAVGSFASFEPFLGEDVTAVAWHERGAAAHVAAAAWITSLIRVELHTFLDALQRRGGWLVACATDSATTDLGPDVIGDLLDRRPHGPGSWHHQNGPMTMELKSAHVYRQQSLDGSRLHGSGTDEVFRVKGARVRTHAAWVDYLDPRVGVGQPGVTGLVQDLRRGKVSPTPTWVVRHLLDDLGGTDAPEDGDPFGSDAARE